MGWKRSGWRASIGWLELLRVLIAVAIAITLNQPEWRETFKPDSKPVLAILRDVSGSMETTDVTDPANPAAPAVLEVPLRGRWRKRHCGSRSRRAWTW